MDATFGLVGFIGALVVVIGILMIEHRLSKVQKDMVEVRKHTSSIDVNLAQLASLVGNSQS